MFCCSERVPSDPALDFFDQKWKSYVDLTSAQTTLHVNSCRPCLFWYENTWRSVDTKMSLRWFSFWRLETSCQVLNRCEEETQEQFCENANWYQNKHGRRPAEGNQLRVCWRRFEVKPHQCRCTARWCRWVWSPGDIYTWSSRRCSHTSCDEDTRRRPTHTRRCLQRESEGELLCQRFITPQRKNHQTDRCRCVCPDPAVTPATDRCIGPPPWWPDSRTDSWHGNRCERLWTQTHQRKAAKCKISHITIVGK